MVGKPHVIAQDLPALGHVSGGEAPRFAPLYVQIEALLTRSLSNGEWQPGALVPSEHELAARYGVSPGTVRKAVDRLVAAHMLVRRQGKGTFVATHLEPRSSFRFLRLRDADGGVPPFGSRILFCRRVRALNDVARSLELKTGEPVVHIRRVLDFDGEPTVLDDIWLPGGRFRGLSAERLAAHAGPLYGLFEAEFGTRMLAASERVRAVLADAEQASLLGVEVASPLLRVERISRTYADERVEFRLGLYRTDHYHYQNDLR